MAGIGYPRRVVELLMRVLIAPDSFKESLSAPEAAQAIVRGLMRVDSELEVDFCPLADGGKGFVDAFCSACDGELRTALVHDALGRQIEAQWCLIADSQLAVLELASACGLHLLSADERDPGRTGTFGLGEIIADTFSEDVQRVIVGLGDSASVDGGVGMCQALGGKFLGLDDFATGGQLQRLESVDLSKLNPRLREIELIGACDVQNPLCGPEGAVRVYGAQKGADAEQRLVLERGLEHLAQMVSPTDALIPGSGAAGG